MPLEEEMRHEIEKLEKEVEVLDVEIKTLYTKVVNLINIRKKKEHNLKLLKENFGIKTDISDKEMQLTLSNLLKEQSKH